MRIKLYDENFKRLTLCDAVLIRIARWQLNRSRQKSLETSYPEIAAYARDYIGADIALYGYWEIQSLKALELICLRFGLHGTFVDIGANIGAYSLALGKSFANIIAFEPNPETHSLLSHNLKFNLDCDYVASQLALGDGSYLAKISTTKANRGGASILPCNYERGEITEVRVETLDSVLETDIGLCEKTAIDLIKIDVEGFEADVIQGAIKTIKDHRPVVAFEWSGCSRVSHSHVKILEELGYRFFLPKRSRWRWLEIASLGSKKGCMSLCPFKGERLKQIKYHINLVIAIPLKYIE